MQSLILSASALITLALAPIMLYLLIITIAAAWFRRRKPEEPLSSWGGRFFVVIPAHDEAGCIGDTVAAVRSILTQRRLPFSVWVVADNCSDKTAELASQAGAQVLERRDPSRRGKGYALSFFFMHLLAQPEIRDSDAVVVIDADTRIDHQLLNAFARRLAQGQDWLQGVSGILNSDASWRTRLMSCSFALINGTWLMGQDGLGLSVSLRGNGMCLAVRGLRRVPWEAFGLAEDIEYSWTLRLAGEHVRFVPDARVFSEIATADPGARMQRQRWEIGRKSVRSTFTRRVLQTSTLSPAAKMLCLLELHMPTLTRLSCLLGFVGGLTWLMPSTTGPGFAVLGAVHIGILGILISYLSSPYWLGLLPWSYALYLFYSPLYMLWKMELLFRKPPTIWIRTAREPRPGADPSPLREGRPQ